MFTPQIFDSEDPDYHVPPKPKARWESQKQFDFDDIWNNYPDRNESNKNKLQFKVHVVNHDIVSSDNLVDNSSISLCELASNDRSIRTWVTADDGDGDGDGDNDDTRIGKKGHDFDCAASVFTGSTLVTGGSVGSPMFSRSTTGTTFDFADDLDIDVGVGAPTLWDSSYSGRKFDSMIPGCTITIIDYSEDRYRIDRRNFLSSYNSCFDIILNSFMNNESNRFYEENEYMKGLNPNSPREWQYKAFTKLVEKARVELIKSLNERPSWVDVRWINVNGLEREVLKILEAQFELPLPAINDMLLGKEQLSKVDYPDHLFCALPLLRLVNVKGPRYKLDNSRIYKTRSCAVSHKGGGSILNKIIGLFRVSNNGTGKQDSTACITDEITTLSELIRDARPHIYLKNEALDSLKTKYAKDPRRRRNLNYMESKGLLNKHGLDVVVENQGTFLIKENNTVISFFNYSGDLIEEMAFEMFRNPGCSFIRQNPDASLLLSELTNCNLRLNASVVSKYEEFILEFQAEMMFNAHLQDPQQPDLMYQDLILLKEPIVHVRHMVENLKKQRMKGFINEDCKSNLENVENQCQSLLDRIDRLSDTTKEFKVTINQSINQYLFVQASGTITKSAFISLILLTWSFLASFFGMNFQHFSYMNHDVTYFWVVAIPVLVVLIIILWPDIGYLLAGHATALIGNRRKGN